MIEERLYSTGNEELDYILEKAFCDGYEYAQREFGKLNLGSRINNFINTRPGAMKDKIQGGLNKYNDAIDASTAHAKKPGNTLITIGNYVNRSADRRGQGYKDVGSFAGRGVSKVHQGLRDMKASYLKSVRDTANTAKTLKDIWKK